MKLIDSLILFVFLCKQWHPTLLYPTTRRQVNAISAKNQ